MSRHKLFRELHRELHDIQTPSEMVQHQREFLDFAREVLREKEKENYASSYSFCRALIEKIEEEIGESGEQRPSESVESTEGSAPSTAGIAGLHEFCSSQLQMLEEYSKNARGPAMHDVLCEFAVEGQFVKEALLDNLEDRFDLQKQRRTIVSRMGEFL